jgi:hypothetical protein
VWSSRCSTASGSRRCRCTGRTISGCPRSVSEHGARLGMGIG